MSLSEISYGIKSPVEVALERHAFAVFHHYGQPCFISV
jgi:hypothetical protein